MKNFKIGDCVFHKSNSTIKWIIDRMDNNEAYCSTIIKESLEQKKEVFALTSIEKCAEPRIIVGKRKRNNFY